MTNFLRIDKLIIHLLLLSRRWNLYVWSSFW